MSLTRRWRECDCLSQFVLTHDLRQATASLILNVRQKKTKPTTLNLPKYDVVLWCSQTGSFADLESSILAKARIEPYEVTAYDGIQDFHWGFEDPIAATKFAESLLEFATLDRVLKLVASSSVDKSFGRVVYTDKTKRK